MNTRPALLLLAPLLLLAGCTPRQSPAAAVGSAGPPSPAAADDEASAGRDAWLEEERKMSGEERKMPLGGATRLRLDVIDVGYGDAILLRAAGRSVLVDCGPREAGPRVASFLERKGVERLDLLVLTHPHPDHLEGLAALLGNVPVGRILHSGLFDEEGRQEEWLRRAGALGIPLARARDGLVLPDLGEEVRLEVLQVGGFPLNLNEASMVLRLVCGERVFLLMADAEGEAEQALLQHNGAAGLKADFVKVGHHGNTSGEEFVCAAAPEVAAVSLGPNIYGAPDEATLAVWRKAGALLLRTDLHGDLTVTTDGRTLEARWTRREGSAPPPDRGD